jgi:hypothetical protein
MVFKRLHSFRRHNAKKENDNSIGETLKPDECFSIEIPQIMSDKATKDSIFLGTASRHEAHGDGSMSSISSVTTDSGSSRTLRSRQTAEAKRKDNGSKKNKQKPSTTNSIAATVCTGAFTSYDDPANGEAKNSEGRDDKALATIMNFLPTCCSPLNHVAVTRVDTDDRSDIALNVLDDDDTIEPIFDNRYRTPESRKQQKYRDQSYGKQENKRFLGFLRRSRSNAKL